MKKLKMLAVALGMVAMVSSALAVPTLIVTDNGVQVGSTTTSASGVVTFSGGDTFWTIVVSTGIAYPPATGQGTVGAPVMDLSVQATSLGTTVGHNLAIYFGSDNNASLGGANVLYGPTSGHINAMLTGQVASGTGAGVTYNTYFATSGALPTLGTPLISGSTLTTTGSLPGPLYNSGNVSGPLVATSYSLEQAVFITGSSAGVSYSLDASLNTTPDGGTTVMLLGAALSGLALLRRKLS